MHENPVTSKTNSTRHTATADWMRVFFAAAVLFVHWRGQFGLAETWWVSPLSVVHDAIQVSPVHFGVTGFIVVSGFCIHLASSGLSLDPRAIAAYLIKRTVRIGPVLVVAAIVAWFIMAKDTVSPWDILSPRIMLALNGPLITVFIELLLYLAYVPLALFIGASPVWGWMAVSALSLLGLLAPFSAVDWLKLPIGESYHSVLAYFPYWWMGAVAAIVYRRRQFSLGAAHVVAISTVVVFMGVLFREREAFFSKFSVSVQLYENLYILAFALAVAVTLAGFRPRMGAKLGNKLSKPSFSLYAIHAPVLFATAAFGPLWGGVAALLSAISLYYAVERPTRRLASKWGTAITNSQSTSS